MTQGGRDGAVRVVGGVAGMVLAVGGAARATVYTAIDLTPSGYSAVIAQGVAGNVQVGAGTFTASGQDHALIWNGSASAFTDVNPATADASTAWGISGNLTVGQIVNGTTPHAGYWVGTGAFQLLPEGGNGSSVAFGARGTTIAGTIGVHAAVWTGSPASGYTLNDLHSTMTPSGYVASLTNGTDGTVVAGAVFVPPTTDTGEHAAVWNLATSTFADLQVGGITDSIAQGAAGNQVVGVASPPGQGAHAMLWQWDGANYQPTDLNPTGALDSFAAASNGLKQAGTVDDANGSRAFLWSETLDGSGHVVSVTAVDLEAVLLANPATATLLSSLGLGMDSQGDVVGVGIDSSGVQHAVLWQAATAARANHAFAAGGRRVAAASASAGMALPGEIWNSRGIGFFLALCRSQAHDGAGSAFVHFLVDR